LSFKYVCISGIGWLSLVHIHRLIFPGNLSTLFMGNWYLERFSSLITMGVLEKASGSSSVRGL